MPKFVKFFNDPDLQSLEKKVNTWISETSYEEFEFEITFINYIPNDIHTVMVVYDHGYPIEDEEYNEDDSEELE